MPITSLSHDLIAGMNGVARPDMRELCDRVPVAAGNTRSRITRIVVGVNNAGGPAVQDCLLHF